MKLITANGSLVLPKDFIMEMERHNPFLSGDGDASVPASVPASMGNLAALGHRERIDRANRYTNKVEAILQVGPVQKRGQLVLNTLHCFNGIEASLAIDSSDLYTRARDKSLKAIFEECDTEGTSKMTWASVEGAMDIMQDCYEGADSYDFTLFPVAVAPYENNNVTYYQLNNEDNGQGVLVYAARTVHEGDIKMSVPEGYGIAPFLKLHRLLHRLFECLGYTMTYNRFAENDLCDIVVMHNCADALVRGTLLYQDLVPSCTLSEFLEWLLAKFHAQPVVNSETKQVSIVIMEDLLANSADEDITEFVEDFWSVQLSPSKRIVLTPTNSIEGTEPANESFDKMVAKYGSYVEADEDQWVNGTLNDCLVLRLATGQFYALTRDLSTGIQQQEPLGTNHFAYDRQNSDDTEAFSQSDTMPLMMVSPRLNPESPSMAFKRCVCPFIGERIHFHTSYQGKEEDSDQSIMVAWKAHNSHFAFRTTGTNQAYIPYETTQAGVTGVTLEFGLTNFAMYDKFWKRYNEIILNHATRVSAHILYNVGAFLNLDMSRPKMCQGQKLLPVSASARLAERMGLTEAEYILCKHFTDGITDTPITPIESPNLKWMLNFDGANDLVTRTWDAAVIDWENNNHTPTEGDNMDDSSATIDDISGSQYLGIPTFVGQIIDMGGHSIKVIVSGIVKYYDGSHNIREASINGYSITYPGIHCWFEAVDA